MKVLVAGGAGYIGSTVALACEEQGMTAVILDDLSTGAREFTAGRQLYVGDIADGALIGRVAEDHPDLHAVVHCAAQIVVPDSVARPLDYYDNNVGKGVAFLRHLQRQGIDRVVFSSSASVYASSTQFVVDEDAPLHPASPYATTKAMFETVLRDAATAGGPRAIALRYFNPIGADPSLRTGLQLPAPSHALGKLITAWRTDRSFTVTGVDWPTRDGSAIRDYIHVWDLARAHVAALQRFDRVAPRADPFQVINIGAGSGVTVRELVAAFQRATGDELHIAAGPRRAGDTVGAYADCRRAATLLGWRAELTLEDGIRDALAWASRGEG